MQRQPTPANAAQPATQAPDHRPLLHEIVAMAADLARILHARTVAIDAAAPATDPATHETAQAATTAFERAARTVRRTLLLIEKLDEPRTTTPSPGRTETRKRILRAVGDSIATSAPRGTAAALQAELLDRLDALDTEADVTTRPIGDIITEITRDLGLETMMGQRFWKCRTPAEIAELNTIAAQPPTSKPPTPQPLTPQPPMLHPPPPHLPDDLPERVALALALAGKPPPG